MEEVKVITPGQKLGSTFDYEAGPGTYTRGTNIYASRLGFKNCKESEDASKVKYQVDESSHSKKNLTNKPKKSVIYVDIEKDSSPVPKIGNIVTGIVVRVNPRLATVKIVSCEDKVLKEEYSGIIRVQEVRATVVGVVVEIYKSFRPGDVVKAEVISLGDARSYYLSTERNDLGVIYAKSVAGAPMVPVSWEYMECTKTRIREPRKVARPQTPSS